ncbi:nucleotidyltransferase family protein [Gilvibacter sediminis]|uniref:nucleotidyltransferase family protein n=1 Tax=Gilvibacter sediminis TaxID=379071 RepID=UPI002350AD1F|nr:nucleotidyltransferase family protein [Gilvibacter sediminis]MDC7996929.1 nucleotidyltransferase family protein [Gilvibacter sediminis]
MSSEISILILAAGKSSRMGTPKMLLPWGDSTVLECIIKKAKALVCKHIVLISGAEHISLEKITQRHAIQITQNPEWERGMGNSLAFGIKTLMNRPPKGVLVLLADMPIITADNLKGLIETFVSSEADIVCTQYPDLQGVPAIFKDSLFEKLSQLDGDLGAKQLFKLEGIRLASHSVQKDYEDLDTPEAYQKLKNKYGL